MNDVYREMGLEDPTEVAKAKLHEEEETKRSHVREKEETKRKRFAMMKEPAYIFTRIGFAVAFTIVCCVYVSYKYPSAPPPPEVCADSIEIIDSRTSVRKCYGGGHFEYQKMTFGSDYLAHCICGPQTK